MKRGILSFLIFTFIFILGAYFRFYKLNWGENNFFHPDEYHIAAAVERLNFPDQMNPKLFSYGSFSVYLIYFTKFLFKALYPEITKIHPILIGRFFSAFFSTLTIIIVYFLARKVFKKREFPFIVSFLVAITPGIIQQAHFATPESTLTFWLFLTLFLIILWHSKKKFIYLVVAASALGVAAATKIVAITFLPLFILVQLSKFKLKLIPLIKNIATLLASISFIALAFAAVFPYSLIDWTSFRSSIEYETGVGNGSILVFYTRQFLDTPSFVFQYQKILAFALGPSLTALGTAGVFLIIYQVISRFFRRKKGVNPEILILTLAFFSLFLPNAILFAKWTRFIAPTFAFWSFFAAHLIQSISETFKKRFSSVTGFFLYFLLVTTFLWAVMFFSIYKRPDIRITATNWIIKNIPANSFILTEAGNMVEVPIWGGIDKKNFDFYNLDENPSLDEELVTYLAKADYFIVQSRRMFTNHQRFPDKFPLTARFYDFLFSERLGFTKIKDFNSFPGLSFAGKTLAVNDEAAEETWSVFDHPVIRIYKKVRPLTEYQYAKLLKI